MYKRFLLIPLVSVCIFSSATYANTYDMSKANEAKLVSQYSSDTSIDQVDTVTFGKYPKLVMNANGDYIDEGQPIEWLVLDRIGDRALLLNKFGFYYGPYGRFHDINEDVTWETCSLRNLLNTEFIDSMFNSYEKSCIQTTSVHTDDSKYGTKGGNDTNDKIFLLSVEEVRKYLGKTKIGLGILRTPGYFQFNVARVEKYGAINEIGSYVNSWTRESTRCAMWVKFK